MRDKSLDILLMVLFGISGTAILTLAWLWPMPGSERIVTTFIGSLGLIVVLVRAWRLRSGRGRRDDEPVPVEVEVKDEPGDILC